MTYSIKDFGAKGDGKNIETKSIQRAIDAAAAAGGGTVVFPAGNYLSFSIRLRSKVELHLSAGATLIAADPQKHGGTYDEAEPNEWDMYQDFGHSHWHNSLIWGEGLEGIAITGKGLINGEGLTVHGPGPRRAPKPGDTPQSLNGADPHGEKVEGKAFGADMVGKGNKAIALKNCRNVSLRDFSISKGGHFAILATGVSQLAINNLTLDTNRDGIDIDCCSYVQIIDCKVNTPNDDAICLKSSFALGAATPTENVIINRCQVSGYDLGSFLDGTKKRTQEFAPDKDRVTGRIKLGTESNGGFKNITIVDCVFERSRGLAIESVDGAIIENILVNNIVMRELTSAPIFVRLGSRMRAPKNSKVGKISNISITNLTATDVDSRFSSIIAGIPGHPVENLLFSNIKIQHKGGGTAADAARELPENEGSYPEPNMFGNTNVHGLFARHVNNIEIVHMEIESTNPDARPAIGLYNVRGAGLHTVNVPLSKNVPALKSKNVTDLRLRSCNWDKNK